jgi:murein DD-endopeptidase MepM/ murein hydrolase activator NlpD
MLVLVVAPLHAAEIRCPVTDRLAMSAQFMQGKESNKIDFVRSHDGIDLPIKSGTDVHAAAKGKVSQVGERGRYGTAISIMHLNSLDTFYGHLSSIRVKEGQSVEQGEVIGVSGNTGLSSGPHLHFGLYKDGNAVDPLDYMK